MAQDDNEEKKAESPRKIYVVRRVVVEHKTVVPPRCVRESDRPPPKPVDYYGETCEFIRARNMRRRAEPAEPTEAEPTEQLSPQALLEEAINLAEDTLTAIHQCQKSLQNGVEQLDACIDLFKTAVDALEAVELPEGYEMKKRTTTESQRQKYEVDLAAEIHALSSLSFLELQHALEITRAAIKVGGGDNADAAHWLRLAAIDRVLQSKRE